VPATVSRTFERAVAELKLPHIGLHGLRHGFATMALSARVHVKVVSEILGHTSTATTSDLYQHVVPSMAADAAGRVAQLVFGESG
jgi:integrase